MNNKQILIEKIAAMVTYGKRPKDVAIKLYDVLAQMIYSDRGRCKKEGFVSELTIEGLVDLLSLYLGKPCKFCGEVIDHKNIGLDHVVPFYFCKESKIGNVQFICKRCNCRKSTCSDSGFKKVMDVVMSLDVDDRKYVLGKLTARGK